MLTKHHHLVTDNVPFLIIIVVFENLHFVGRQIPRFLHKHNVHNMPCTAVMFYMVSGKKLTPCNKNVKSKRM